jgi:hypothetical protein
MIIDGADKLGRDGKPLYPKGVTVVESIPGHPVPDGIFYVEQLSEDLFASNYKQKLVNQGMTRGQAAAEIKRLQTVLAKHPVRDVVKPVAERTGSGFVFKNALTGNWWAGDADLQSLEILGGVWPPGKKGQILTEAAAKLRNIPRLPMHGWSDDPTDLPSDKILLAMEFGMKHASPEAGPAAAADYSASLASLATQFRAKATQLQESSFAKLAQSARTTVPGLAGRLEKQAAHEQMLSEKWLKQAAEFSKLTPEALIKKWPPGTEKTIVLVKGKAVIGYGTAGQR